MGKNIDTGTLEESEIIVKRLLQIQGHEIKKGLDLDDGIQGEGGGINLSDISLRERDSACESRWKLP